MRVFRFLIFQKNSLAIVYDLRERDSAIINYVSVVETLIQNITSHFVAALRVTANIRQHERGNSETFYFFR